MWRYPLSSSCFLEVSAQVPLSFVRFCSDFVYFSFIVSRWCFGSCNYCLANCAEENSVILCYQVRIARIFNTYGPRMCIDDGRVVSNFVAQVDIHFRPFLNSAAMAELFFHLSTLPGPQKGAYDCLWRWEADQKLPVRF